MAHPAPSRMTYDAYLAAEATADVKHEYLRGEVFAMAGGTPTHARLAAAIIGELRNALADRPCEVFTSDLRVRIDATDLSTYPDVTVVCSDLQSSELDVNATTNPILIVEVLSESTEAEQSVVNPITAPRAGIFGEGEEPKRSCTGRTASFGDNALVEKNKRGVVRGFTTDCHDRGEKFAHYRRLPSLREYLLVSSGEPRLESYARNAAGEWVLHEAGPGESLVLRSLADVRLETNAIYRNRLAG